MLTRMLVVQVMLGSAKLAVGLSKIVQGHATDVEAEELCDAS